MNLLLIFENSFTSLVDNLDSEVVAVAEVAILAPYKERLVKMVDNDAHGELSNLQLVENQLILILNVDNYKGAKILQKKQDERQCDQGTPFLSEYVLEWIFLANLLQEKAHLPIANQ